MNDALRMQISAFVDDELPETETELLLRRLSQDAELRRQAAEYLRIGRLIRGDRDIPGMGELRNRIAMALGEEPADTVIKIEAARNRYLKPAAGIAIAASVAALALVGLRQFDAPEPGLAPGSGPETLATTGARDPGYTEPLPEELLSDQPGEMLMQYYLSHGESSAGLGANGILTRLVTLELREGELVEVEPGQGAIAPGAGSPVESPETPKDNDKENRSREP